MHLSNLISKLRGNVSKWISSIEGKFKPSELEVYDAFKQSQLVKKEVFTQAKKVCHWRVLLSSYLTRNFVWFVTVMGCFYAATPSSDKLKHSLKQAK